MIRTRPDLDPKCRIIKSPDPTNKDCWPKAPSKFVFIFEAINLAGAALFNDEWTGKELAVVHWSESPRAGRAGARLLPARGGGARGSHSIGGVRVPQKPAPALHVQDWLAEQHQPLWEENGRALKRLEKAIEWLAQRCRDGELTSHARFREAGGNLYPMRAAEWNIESPLSYFVVNGGNKRHFPELRHSGPFEAFVFFEKHELLEALKREPDAPLLVGEADLSRLSPYLRLAVHVALKRGYFAGATIDATPTREAEVAAVWADFLPDVPMTTTGQKQLAKLIGFPNPKAINQGQRGGRTRKTGSTHKP